MCLCERLHWSIEDVINLTSKQLDAAYIALNQLDAPRDTKHAIKETPSKTNFGATDMEQDLIAEKLLKIKESNGKRTLTDLPKMLGLMK